MSRCNYTAPDGWICKRPPHGGGQLCQYHLPADHKHKELSAGFAGSIKTLLATEDELIWKGFIFPKDMRLANIEIDKILDLSYAEFNGVDFIKVVFSNEVGLNKIKTTGDFNLFDVVFKKPVSFAQSKFSGEFFSSSRFLGRVDFSDCELRDRATFKGMFEDGVSFSDSSFEGSVDFRGVKTQTIHAQMEVVAPSAVMSATASLDGEMALLPRIKNELIRIWRTIDSYLSKSKKMLLVKIKQKFYKCLSYSKRCLNIFLHRWFGVYREESTEVNRLFYGPVNLERVDFQRPDSVRFIEVDLRKAAILGTNLKGVQFYDIDWYQPRLKRRGLYQDVSLRDSKTINKKSQQASVEEACRNIRVSLELNKNYDAASDFFIGERDMHRMQLHPIKQYFLSVDAWYNALSRYGTSTWRAGRILLWLLLGHLLATVYLLNDPALVLDLLKGGGTNEGQTLGWPGLLVHTLQIFTLQKVTADLFLQNSTIALLDACFRGVAPVMIAILALSFRSRIKRH